VDSRGAEQPALAVARLFAERLHEPLVLVHAVNPPVHDGMPSALCDALSAYARELFTDRLVDLAKTGVETIADVRTGGQAEALSESALTWNARLIVLSTRRCGADERSMHNLVHDDVVVAAAAPTLFIGSEAPFKRWMAGRRLRVVAGMDASTTMLPVLRWISWLRHVGPCDVVVLRFDDESGVSERSFRRAVQDSLGAHRVRVRIEKGWNWSDAHVIGLASEERADLLVLGGASGGACPWRGVLRYAPMSVACIRAP